jgi:hypothetical protein
MSWSSFIIDALSNTLFVLGIVINRSIVGQINAIEKEQHPRFPSNTTNCAMTAIWDSIQPGALHIFSVWPRRTPARVGTARRQTAWRGMASHAQSDLIELIPHPALP